MQVLIAACTFPSTRVRVFAYECLVKIVSLYYEYLPEQMDTLSRLTFHTMENDNEADVVKQAIEFWSSVCDEEITLLEREEVQIFRSLMMSLITHRLFAADCNAISQLYRHRASVSDEVAAA